MTTFIINKEQIEHIPKGTKNVICREELKTIIFRGYFNDKINNVKFPEHLQTLDLGFEFDQSVDGVQFPQNLQTLIFGCSFNQSLDKVFLPPNLQTLIFKRDFNKPINKTKFPQNLKTLIFGEKFNQSIKNIEFPQKLKNLTFGDYFFQPVEGVKFPETIETLKTGRNIINIKFPQNLKTLTFSHSFNESINGIVFPENLRVLNFGDFFNISLDLVNFPQNLQEINFGIVFDKSIDGVIFPKNIRKLHFGCYFNQSIENVNFPENLEILNFGRMFNKPIVQVKFPKNLKELEFGFFFNRPIENVKFPENLQRLTFGFWFDKSIDGVKFPRKLQSLTFGESFDQCLDNIELPYLVIVKNGDNEIIYNGLEKMKKLLTKPTKSLRLLKPDIRTEWMKIAYKPKKDITDDDHKKLKNYAELAQIRDYQNMTHRQLCSELSRSYDIFIDKKKTQKKIEYSQNDSTLEGDDFTDMDQDEIIVDDNGYCFTKEELEKINTHPYTNIPWDSVYVKGQKIKDYAKKISSCSIVHRLIPSNQQIISQESILIDRLTEIINQSISGSSKYIHPHQIKKYDLKSQQRNNIINALYTSNLTQMYLINIKSIKSYQDWLEALIEYINKIPNENKETSKYLIIELMNEFP